jgi:hypothetical protein
MGLEDLHYKFVTDRRILSLNQEIALLYSRGIPRILATSGEPSLIYYDDNTENEVRRCKSIRDEIIKKEYSELFNYKTD